MAKVPREMVGNPVLVLFRAGFSTFEIAEAKNKPEATIYNWLDQSRENERRLISELGAASGG
jgi:hypothetical protein